MREDTAPDVFTSFADGILTFPTRLVRKGTIYAATQQSKNDNQHHSVLLLVKDNCDRRISHSQSIPSSYHTIQLRDAYKSSYFLSK